MMTWLRRVGMARWELTRVGDIPVCLHWSWALVPLLLAWARLGRQTTWAPVEDITTVVVAAAFAGCSVAHELGHAWVGRRFGISDWVITLTVAGGVLTSAKLWPGRLRPGQEVLLALGGPVASLGAAGALVMLGRLVGHDGLARWLDTLGLANLAIAAFNLLPVFPLDGGRLLRALLTCQAATWAAPAACWCSVSLSLALLLGGLLWLAPGLLIVGGVAIVATWQELGQLVEDQPEAGWLAWTRPWFGHERHDTR